MPINSSDSFTIKEIKANSDLYDDFSYIEGLWLTEK